MFDRTFFTHGDAPPAVKSRRALTRAVFFAGVLVLLWVGMQALSPAAKSSEPSVFSDESGAVAVRPGSPLHKTDSVWQPGVIVSIVLLAGGIAVAAYLRRRGVPSGLNSESIRDRGQLALAPGQQVRLIECAGQVLLIGVTSSSITVLNKFSQDEFDAALAAGEGLRNDDSPSVNGIGGNRANLNVRPVDAQNFGALFKSYLGVQPATGHNGHNGRPSTSR